MEETGFGSGLLPTVVRPTFLADPYRVSWNRGLMAVKITMMLEGEMRRKFRGVPRGMTHSVPVRLSRDLCAPFSRVNEFPLLSLYAASSPSLPFFRAEEKGRRRRRREEMTF